MSLYRFRLPDGTIAPVEAPSEYDARAQVAVGAVLMSAPCRACDGDAHCPNPACTARP